MMNADENGMDRAGLLAQIRALAEQTVPRLQAWAMDPSISEANRKRIQQTLARWTAETTKNHEKPRSKRRPVVGERKTEENREQNADRERDTEENRGFFRAWGY